MNLTFAAQLNKMITAGLGGAVEAPETGVAVGRRVEYTSIGPAPVLTFEANSELPLKALSVNMEPIQDLHGQANPYPAGANTLFSFGASRSGYTWSDGFGFSDIDASDSSVLLNGTATSDHTFSVPGGSITLSAGTYTASLSRYDGVRVELVNNEGTVTITDSAKTFTLNAQQNISATIVISSGASFDHERLGIQINSGSTAAPYANICPISGRQSVTVTRSGVNVWDEEWELGGYDTNGNKVEISSRIRSKNKIPCVPNTTYYFASTVYTSWAQINFYDVNGNFVSLISPYVNTTFTTPSDSHYMTFNTSSRYGETYNNNISINYPSTDHDYHPGTVASVEVQLGQTVYGGTVDVVSGEMVVDMAMVDMGALAWVYNSTAQVFWSSIDQMKRPGTLVCSQYAYQPNGNVEDLLNGEIWNRGYTYNANNIVVKDTVYADVATFETAMNGVQLCYELAEPITVQLTPEQITTVLGTNNVWSDADELSLTYGNIYYTEGY